MQAYHETGTVLQHLQGRKAGAVSMWNAKRRLLHQLPPPSQAWGRTSLQMQLPRQHLQSSTSASSLARALSMRQAFAASLYMSLLTQPLQAHGENWHAEDQRCCLCSALAASAKGLPAAAIVLHDEESLSTPGKKL